jgi:peptidoglycan hydrolase CwlO-like protein
MIRTAMVRNLVAVAAITLVSVSVSGCDYWPPALQTQIEQLQSELQSATIEKAQLQSQLTSIAKVKDLSRASQDKSTMIASLQNGLAAAQERLAKSARVAAPKVGAVKPSIKVAPKKVTHKAPPKAPVKKKTPAKIIHKH